MSRALRAVVMVAAGATAAALALTALLPKGTSSAAVAIRNVVPGPAAPADPEFGSWWHDGKAELDGYRYTVQRYGHSRTGRAVAIYVTEPFSRSRHVKLDDPARTPADAVEVLKLNLMRDFQTGIYDYHTMLSLFATAQDFTPLKLAFTSSEWCGQVSEQIDAVGRGLRQRVASYFEGESVEQTLPSPPGGIQEDALFILLRGLRGPWLRAGETRTVPFLSSPFHRRLAHRPATWGRATIQRLAGSASITVPAGQFTCDVYTIHSDDGRSARFEIERAYPNRIVRWRWAAGVSDRPRGGKDQAGAQAGSLRASTPDGRDHVGPPEGTDGAELAGSVRLDYWRTNTPGDEKLLAQIGLGPAVK